MPAKPACVSSRAFLRLLAPCVSLARSPLKQNVIGWTNPKPRRLPTITDEDGTFSTDSSLVGWLRWHAFSPSARRETIMEINMSIAFGAETQVSPQTS